MNLKIEGKRMIIKSLNKKFSKCNFVVLTDYKGLDVESMNLLRRRLRKAGIVFQVVKNSLLKKASEGTFIKIINNHFNGPSAIAISYDEPINLAKILTDFSSEHKDLKIKIAVLDNKILLYDDIKYLSSLPSREVLILKLMFSIKAVPSSLVNLLTTIVRNFINVLKCVKSKKELIPHID